MRQVGDIHLETRRLVLREFELRDHEAVQVYAGDSEVTRFTSWGPNTVEMTAEVLQSWLEQRSKTPRIEWPIAIIRRSDGVLIGGTGIGQVDWQNGTAIFGYVLRREAWGHGFATEAGFAVVNWAFSQLQLKSLIAHCDPQNQASMRVLSKLGFSQQDGLTSFQKPSGESLSFVTHMLVRPA
jgi:ribosomal-protein-alanine N-acetyltransferase